MELLIKATIVQLSNTVKHQLWNTTKKTVIESILRAIREQPDEIIQWAIEETPDGGLRVGGFIDFNKPKIDDTKPV